MTRTILVHALAILGLASAFAQPIVPAVTARLKVRVIDPDAVATFESSDAAPRIELLPRGDAFESVELPLPIDGVVELRARDAATQRFRVSFGRAENGIVDLGIFDLAPGTPQTLLLVDEESRPIERAAIYSIAPASTFPPGDSESDLGPKTRLDVDSRLGETTATGEFVVTLPADRRNLAIFPPNHAPLFVTLPQVQDDPLRCVATSGVPLDLEIRTEAERLLPQEGVRVTFDLGGIGFDRFVPVNQRVTIPFDLDRALRITIEARGFKTTVHRVATFAAEPVTIDFEPVPLAFARLTARDAVTKEPLILDSLRLGRARAHPNEFPGRLDFAPDWNSFRIGTEEPALVAAPPGNVDALLAAAFHRESVVRGLRFEGTFERPTPLVVDLPGDLPVAGRVVDANTGSPVAGAIVTVRKSSRDIEDLPLVWKIRGTVGFLTTVRTDANGRFRFDCSAFENLVFEVEAAGLATTTSGPFPRGKTHDLTLSIGPGVTLAGRVEAPRPGEVVAIFEVGSKRLRCAPLDDSGHFSIHGVPPLDHRIVALPDPRAGIARGLVMESTRLEQALESKSAQRVDGTREIRDLVISRAEDS